MGGHRPPDRLTRGRQTTDALAAVLAEETGAAPDDGEGEATREAVAALDAHGHSYRILHVAVTGMRHIKIRRKGRQPSG